MIVDMRCSSIQRVNSCLSVRPLLAGVQVPQPNDPYTREQVCMGTNLAEQCGSRRHMLEHREKEGYLSHQLHYTQQLALLTGNVTT